MELNELTPNELARLPKLVQKAITKKDIKAAILRYIEDYDNVSFVEIDQRLGKFFNLRGDRHIEFPGRNNLIAWLGMSQEFVDTIIALMAEDKIYGKTTTWLVYLVDGAALKLPLARSTKKNPRKPHWVPIVLRPTAKEKTESLHIRQKLEKQRNS